MSQAGDMPREPPVPPEPREGIFLPNFDKLSDEWRAFLAAESEEWQAKLDRFVVLLEELRDEVRKLQGLTVTINREE